MSDCVQTPSKPTFSVTLADIMYHNEEHSFLAFLRLIGSVHFKSINQLLSPHQQPGLTPFVHQSGLIHKRRKRIYHPEDSLKYLWKIFMWTANTWRQALQNTMEPLAIKHYGSEHTGDTINVVWESDHNVHQARERGQFYTANVKQTVQSVSVDVLGSTALVGQDVYVNPVCVKIHTALETTIPAEIVALIQTSHQVLIAYLQVRKNR